MAQELLLTVDEAARRLQVGRSFVYKLMASGLLASVKVGGKSRRIPAGELERFVAELIAAGSSGELAAVC